MYAELGIVVALTMGITQALKQAGMHKRYAGVVSLLLGIGLTILFSEAVTTNVIIVGILSGLSASGLYSGTKAAVTK
jgi:hypothetical protein